LARFYIRQYYYYNSRLKANFDNGTDGLLLGDSAGKTAEKGSSFRWPWAWHILSWPRVRFRRFYPAVIVRKKVMNKKNFVNKFFFPTTCTFFLCC